MEKNNDAISRSALLEIIEADIARTKADIERNVHVDKNQAALTLLDSYKTIVENMKSI